MIIETTDAKDYKVAKLTGVIDEDSRVPFDEHLHPIVSEEEKNLILDLSGADRITSAGITHLVTLVSRANTKGSRVVLANATPFVKSILAVTKLTKFFDVAETIDDGAQLLSKN